MLSEPSNTTPFSLLPSSPDPIVPATTTTSYVMRTDQAEIDRLLAQNLTVNQSIGWLVPPTLVLTGAETVLDIGCGPGGWSLALAEQYPQMGIEGLDNDQDMVGYATRQARAASCPRLHYSVGNALLPLSYASETFEIVHARFINSFVHRQQWIPLLRELFRVTRPGGYLVLTECDDLGDSSSPALARFIELTTPPFRKAGHYAGRPLGLTIHLRHFLKTVGYRETNCQPHVVDYSADHQKEHQAIYQNFAVAFQGFRPFAVEKCKISADDYDALYQQFLHEILLPDFRGLWYFLSAWGQKPL